jgi:hypothetical protein
MALEIHLTIPDDLARDAEEFGLLEPEILVTLLQLELERRVNDLVNEEIHAHRAEKRSGANLYSPAP